MIAPLLDRPDVTIVTGAAGWFGTGLIHAFCGDGEWSRPGLVRVLVENQQDAQRLAALSTADTRIVPTVGDLRSGDGIAELFSTDKVTGNDATVDVIHAAGVIHPVNVAAFHEVNTAGTRRIVEASAAHGARRLVHVSSNSPFGTNAGPGDTFGQNEPYRPYFGYGESKMNAELEVLRAAEAGLNAVIVRPPWFYGPHQPPRQTTFFQMVRTGKFPIFGDGRQRRSMTYIDNLIQGVCRAELVATEPGLGWWVADERPYEIVEIVETVGDALRRAGYEVATNRFKLPNAIGYAAEAADRILQSTGNYQQQVHVLGEMNKTIACSIDATTRDLGYVPTVDLAEGMFKSVTWCQEAGFEL